MPSLLRGRNLLLSPLPLPFNRGFTVLSIWFPESRERHFLKFTLALAASFSGKYTFDQPLFQANVNCFILCKRASGTQISLYPSDAVIKYYLANSGEKQDSLLKFLSVTRNYVKIQPWPSVLLV